VTTSIADDGGSTASASSGTLVFGTAAGGGTYVIGDRSASGAVTFWSPQWAKRNSLTGGAGPSSFKGFAGGSQQVCGAHWTAAPGATEGDPTVATLPTYMAVLVASSVSKSGSTVAGNAVRVVIVKTDPGAGTGTVVATLPGC
jgi:hypothetical protein